MVVVVVVAGVLCRDRVCVRRAIQPKLDLKQVLDLQQALKLDLELGEQRVRQGRVLVPIWRAPRGNALLRHDPAGWKSLSANISPRALGIMVR